MGVKPASSTRRISVSPLSAVRVASRSAPALSKTQPEIFAVFCLSSVRSPVEMRTL